MLAQDAVCLRVIASQCILDFFDLSADGRSVDSLLTGYICRRKSSVVRFLDWKVSSVNRLINIKRKEIKILEAMKHSMVSSAVTRGLNPDVPMKFSGVKWLGDIPVHWQTIKLRQLLHPVSIKNHPELPLLSVVREQGVIVRDINDKEANHNYIPDDLSGYMVSHIISLFLVHPV